MTVDERLNRIETKLDAVLDGHGQRLAKTETQLGYLHLAAGFILTSLAALLSFFVKKG